MIYANQARAMEVAADLNANLKGYGTHRAALTDQGWTISRVSPYSNSKIIEWAPESL